MKLTIIVPAYNEEKKISKTLESLKSQTFKDFELIVVDNNSTDKTNEIAKKFTENVVVEKAKGYINAANTGAKLAKGDLIAFCDADSIYPKNWVKKVLTIFEKKPNIVALYGTCNTYDANFIMNFFSYYFFTGFLLVSRLFGLDNTSGFNFIMRKKEFFEVNGFDPNYTKMSPDIYLGVKLKSKGKVLLAPTLRVYSSFRRFQHGGVIKTTLFFLKNWWQFLKGAGPSASYEEYNKEIR